MKFQHQVHPYQLVMINFQVIKETDKHINLDALLPPDVHQDALFITPCNDDSLERKFKFDAD